MDGENHCHKPLRRCTSKKVGVRLSSKNASKVTPKSHLDLKFDSRFLRRLTEKKGPLDLTPGAVDLRSTVTTSEGIEDDMFFEDSECTEQWLSLLEQGMWWPLKQEIVAIMLHG